jgi:hypothetical protein
MTNRENMSSTFFILNSISCGGIGYTINHTVSEARLRIRIRMVGISNILRNWIRIRIKGEN